MVRRRASHNASSTCGGGAGCGDARCGSCSPSACARAVGSQLYALSERSTMLTHHLSRRVTVGGGSERLYVHAQARAVLGPTTPPPVRETACRPHPDPGVAHPGSRGNLRDGRSPSSPGGFPWPLIEQQLPAFPSLLCRSSSSNLTVPLFCGLFSPREHERGGAVVCATCRPVKPRLQNGV